MATKKTTKGKSPKATIAAPLQTEVSFNAKGKHVLAMIDAGIAAQTTVISNAVVAQIKSGWLACKAGEMSPAHADQVLIAINKGVAAANDATFKAKDLDGARVSDTRTALKIHDWKCVKNGALAAALAEIGTLKFEGLIAIVRWMKGTPKVKAHWRNDLESAPGKADLLKVIRAKKTRATKSTKRKTRKGSATVVGMPGDADRGLGHVIKCAIAFNKAHGKFLPASDAKLMAGVIDTLNALFKPTRALMKTREEAAAAKAAK